MKYLVLILVTSISQAADLCTRSMAWDVLQDERFPEVLATPVLDHLLARAKPIQIETGFRHPIYPELTENLVIKLNEQSADLPEVAHGLIHLTQQSSEGAPTEKALREWPAYFAQVNFLDNQTDGKPRQDVVFNTLANIFGIKNTDQPDIVDQLGKTSASPFSYFFSFLKRTGLSIPEFSTLIYGSFPSIIQRVSLLKILSPTETSAFTQCMARVVLLDTQSRINVLRGCSNGPPVNFIKEAGTCWEHSISAHTLKISPTELRSLTEEMVGKSNIPETESPHE